MTLPRWFLSPVAVVVAAVCLHFDAMAYALLRQKWDISGFVHLGHQMPWANDPTFDAVTRRAFPKGYDGQAYYAIARAPFADHRERLDHPVRQTRILYPFACYLASAGGHPRALLWAMPLLNLCAIGLMAWLAAVYARGYGRSAWWGLLLPFMVNALVPAVRNLTDAFAMVAVLALLLAWERRWSPVAVGLLAAAAVLAREQNAAVVALFGGAALMNRRWRDAAALAVGGAALFAWMGYLHSLYGVWPVMPTEGNLAPPFVGIQHWYEYASRSREEWFLRVLIGTYFVGCLLALTWRLARDRNLTLASCIGWGGVALAVVIGPEVTGDYWGYSRSLFWLPLGAWASAVRAGCTPVVALGLLSMVFVRGTLNVL